MSKAKEAFYQAILAERERRRLEAQRYDWARVGRPEQQLPTERAWTQWLILAGRGWGKTRTGAETVRQWARAGKNEYINLIGATVADTRDVMIEGESGILAICPKDERPQYIKNARKLVWPNGAKSLIFSAEQPDRLRGPQHHKLWCDEIAAWRYPDAWTQAEMGLRLGCNPQAVITTTPRPTPLIRELIANPDTFITAGSTYDNKANLAPKFLEQIIKKYEGTRLGRQELMGELLGDNPGALWQIGWIEAARVTICLVPLKRIVLAIDPAATSNSNSDETGIIVAGLGGDGRGYVLDDLSLRGSPQEWAAIAVAAYHKYSADRIIGETNNGGEMIEALIRTVDRNVSYRAVHASRGKVTRAEPISALYEQGRVSHVGTFARLEDQMTDYDPRTAKHSPDRMDALVWALTDLMTEPTPGQGWLDYMHGVATALPPQPL